MKYRNTLIAALIALITVGTAMAQPMPDEPGRRSRRGDRMQHRNGRSTPPHRPMVIDELIDALDLAPEQKAKVDAITKEHMEALRKQGPEARNSKANKEYAQQMRTLRREFRNAQREKNSAKIREVKAKLQELRKNSPQTKMHKELFDKVEKILTDEQKVKFNEIKTELLSGQRRISLTDPNLLRMALQSLDLTEEQDTKIRKLFREERNKDRDRDPMQPMADRRTAGRKLLKNVKAVLTPEQQKELADWMPTRNPHQMLQQPRTLRRALKSIELADHQASAIDGLFENYRSNINDAAPKDTAAKKALRAKLTNDVMALLDQQQKDDLIKAVAPTPGGRHGGYNLKGPGRRHRGNTPPPPADNPQD